MSRVAVRRLAGVSSGGRGGGPDGPYTAPAAPPIALPRRGPALPGLPLAMARICDRGRPARGITSVMLPHHTRSTLRHMCWLLSQSAHCALSAHPTVGLSRLKGQRLESSFHIFNSNTRHRRKLHSPYTVSVFKPTGRGHCYRLSVHHCRILGLQPKRGKGRRRANRYETI